MRHPRYEAMKAWGPHKEYPIQTAMIRYWEHCENEHGASPDDFGMDVLSWHSEHHPDCTTLPTYQQAISV